MAQVVANWLVPYIGRVSISKRLLQDFWLSVCDCDVQMCRRDRISEVAVKWWLPWWLPAVHVRIQFQSTSFPLVVSIHAPRFIPCDADVWQVIFTEDLVGLQGLFEARAASIYDVSEGGATLLWVSCLTAVTI